jgi:hypothetical protein
MKKLLFIVALILVIATISSIAYRATMDVIDIFHPFANWSLTADNKFVANIDGYASSCKGEPSIFKRIDGSWTPARDDAHPTGYGRCNTVVCSKISRPITVYLVEYSATGVSPAGYGTGAFRTTPLTGTFRVDVPYFTDPNCWFKRTLSVKVNR